jgi:hypothetical protein
MPNDISGLPPGTRHYQNESVPDSGTNTQRTRALEEGDALMGGARPAAISNASACCSALLGFGCLVAGLGTALATAYVVESQFPRGSTDDRLRMAGCAASATAGVYMGRAGSVLLAKACGMRRACPSATRALTQVTALAFAAMSTSINIGATMLFSRDTGTVAPANTTLAPSPNVFLQGANGTTVD